MRVLILSCSAGEGHNMAARAVQEELLRQGHESHMMDIMDFSSKFMAHFVHDGYVNLVKYAPRVFYGIYKTGDLIGSPKRKSPVYYLNSRLADNLKKQLDENNYDIVLTTHVFGAQALTYLKHKRGLTIPFIAIATDYTSTPLWEETDCDYFVIPHKELIDEFYQKGIPKEKLLPFGIPVSMKFQSLQSKQEAKIACDLDPDKPACLIMSGSMGFGQISEFASRLAKACDKQEQIVIICGHNKVIYDALSKQFQNKPLVHIIGFTNRVADYMHACDVIFTKPGGLSSSEAASARIPIIHTRHIPGCESKNVNFFTSHGLSIAAKSIDDQVTYGIRLLRFPERRKRMIEAQKREINANAAYDIVQFMVQYVSQPM